MLPITLPLAWYTKNASAGLLVTSGRYIEDKKRSNEYASEPLCIWGSETELKLKENTTSIIDTKPHHRARDSRLETRDSERDDSLLIACIGLALARA